MRNWYRLTPVAKEDGSDPTEAELFVFDVIGKSFWDDETVTAKAFIAELGALPKSVSKITVRINSPGGDPFDAHAIANALKDHPAEIAVSIEGLAASAASLVAMGGGTITIAENALMMIHNPWTIAMGEAKQMRAEAEALDRIRIANIATYRWHSELSEARIAELMDAATWMNAAEALENGFATEIGAPMKAAALVDPRIAAKLGPIPEKYAALVQVKASEERPQPDPPPAPVPDPAPAAASKPANVVDIEAFRADAEAKKEKQIRAQWTEREKKFRSRLDTMKHLSAERRLDLERSFIQVARDEGDDAAIAKVFDQLATDGPEIVSIVNPLGPSTEAKQINAKSIYAKLNVRSS
jgi:ATP-dependent protease ClpP protease subunit